jgi:ketosteroid isomerase-like protein
VSEILSGNDFAMKIMSEDNLNLVRGVYQSRDIGEIAAIVAPVFEIHQTELLPWGGHYRGLAGAEQFFSKLRGSVDSAVEIEEIFPGGEKVVVKGRTRGTTSETNKKFDVSIVHIWTTRAGKLTKFEPFIDTPAMLRALE